LGELRERGYIAQAWEGHGAPWLPTRGLDGVPVRVVVNVERVEVTP
jgi:hypothetical protein